jgi:putative PIN family toxin of toxin-antitoxin system
VSETPRPIVVIDTQLLLRATLNPKSLPARVLFQMGDAYLLAVSPDVRAEVQDVLTRPKIRAKFPQMTDEAVAKTLAVLDAGLQISPDTVAAVSRDPKDDKFIALAVESKAAYLVSEDNDLLVLDPYRGIRILTALDFIQILAGLAADNLAAEKGAPPEDEL